MKKIILLFFIITSILVINAAKNDNPSNKRAVIIIAPKDFRDEELFIPKEVLEKHNFKVDVASIEKGTAIGMLGGKYKVSKLISELKIKDYEIILIAGGAGSPKYLWNNHTLLKFIKKAHKAKKIIGAICLSPAVLAEAGLLKGKKATIFPAKIAIKELKKYGATYVKSGVVISSSQIITASSPAYAEEYALKAIELLKEKSSNDTPKKSKGKK